MNPILKNTITGIPQAAGRLGNAAGNIIGGFGTSVWGVPQAGVPMFKQGMNDLRGSFNNLPNFGRAINNGVLAVGNAGLNGMFNAGKGIDTAIRGTQGLINKISPKKTAPIKAPQQNQQSMFPVGQAYQRYLQQAQDIGDGRNQALQTKMQ